MNPAAKKVFVLLLSVAAGLVLLGLGLLVVWRMRLASDVNHQLAALRAAGLPTNGQEANAYYTNYPDNQNAAVKMALAFAALTNYPDFRSNDVMRIKFPARNESLTPEQSNLLSGYCAMNSNALALAREAIQLPHARYPIDMSWGAKTRLPHLAKLRSLAQAAEFHSLFAPNDSAMDISSIISMARTLDTEPVWISKLVRFAMMRIAVSSLERRLNANGLGEEDLKSLEQPFALASDTNQMVNGLVGERALHIPNFRMSWAEINRIVRHDDQEPSGPPAAGPQPFIFKFTGFFERDLRFYLAAMQTNISLAAAYPKDLATISNVEEQILHTAKKQYYIFSGLLLPAAKSAIIKEATSVAQLRTAQAAIAIERFRLARGKLPDQLDDLVPQFLPAVPQDPFDGEPLRYRRLETGYVVYSVGSDGQDNGGRERPTDAKFADKTNYDITFTVAR
jgi:hypothetical protein